MLATSVFWCKANVNYVFEIKGLKGNGVVTNGQLSYDI